MHGGKTLYEAAYDSCGRIAMLEGTRYQYDKAGRLQQAESEHGIRAVYRYNKNGMQREVVCGNGLRTTYGYDSRNQVISLNAGFEGKAPLLQAVYQYDGNGNRVVKEEKSQRNLGIQQKTECIAYSYDKMNRLTRESRNGNETSYSYDLAGNRTSRIQAGNKETYRYNSRNQLTELTCDNRKNIRYSYDFAGNLVEENDSSATEGGSKIKYIYDSYNRNTEVRGSSFCQKNIYDAEGYRCRLEENEKVTDFVYRAGMLLGEKSEENEPKQTYVLGNEYIGLVSETEKESTAWYYGTDEQGSVRYVLNGNGEVESYYQYDAFGETVTREGNQSRLQYNSQIWDEVSGLYYLRARYYNPRTGRFTQEDVIYNDGLNLYAYCNSNPVIYSDPSGFTGMANSTNPNCGTKSGDKETKTLSEWLENDRDLLEETRKWYKNNPEWWSINPNEKPVFCRTQSEVNEIRKNREKVVDIIHMVWR